MAKNKVKTTETNFTITIPISNIIHGIELKPDFPLKIKDREKMLDYFKEHFFEFGEDNGESDVGIMFHLFEQMADQAFENGEEWLEEIKY
jgi:hypothetical protein